MFKCEAGPDPDDRTNQSGIFWISKDDLSTCKPDQYTGIGVHSFIKNRQPCHGAAADVLRLYHQILKIWSKIQK